MNILGLFAILALSSSALASLPRNEAPQATNDRALKEFLMRNNRLPFANETVAATEQPRVKDWTTCEGCKLLVTELRSIIKNPQEVAHLKELLGRVCQLRIMSRYQAECLNMVNNLVTVLHEIEPLLDNPTAVCQELQYCPESIRGQIAPARRLVLLLAFQAVRQLRPANSPLKDVVCDECIFAVTELKSLVQSASIQAELKQELHKLCRMAGQYETECSALVDQYFDLLIQEMVQLLNNGRQVCVDIGFCQSTAETATRTGSVPLIRIRPAISSRAGRVSLRRLEPTSQNMPLETFLFVVQRLQTRNGINAGCLVCRAAFTEAIDLLSQERVATAVTTDLSNFACGILPESMKTGCLDFMKIYSRAFLQMVLKQYTAPEICGAMGVCKPEDERKIEQLSPSEKSAAVCEACQVVSQYLSFEFQQPDFQQEVVNTLKGGCRILPGDYKLQVRCESYAQTYIPYVMENIMAPKMATICPTLNMCPGRVQVTATVPAA